MWIHTHKHTHTYINIYIHIYIYIKGWKIVDETTMWPLWKCNSNFSVMWWISYCPKFVIVLYICSLVFKASYFLLACSKWTTKFGAFCATGVKTNATRCYYMSVRVLESEWLGSQLIPTHGNLLRRKLPLLNIEFWSVDIHNFYIVSFSFVYVWPTWGRQDPGGSHVGPINLAIRLSTFAIG